MHKMLSKGFYAQISMHRMLGTGCVSHRIGCRVRGVRHRIQGTGFLGAKWQAGGWKQYNIFLSHNVYYACLDIINIKI